LEEPPWVLLSVPWLVASLVGFLATKEAIALLVEKKRS
jgi:hypothetical protein